MAIYCVSASLGQILLLFIVFALVKQTGGFFFYCLSCFPLPWNRFSRYLWCSRSCSKQAGRFLSWSRSLGTDFVDICGVCAREANRRGRFLWLFIVFPFLWDRFCWYLWRSRSSWQDGASPAHLFAHQMTSEKVEHWTMTSELIDSLISTPGRGFTGPFPASHTCLSFPMYVPFWGSFVLDHMCKRWNTALVENQPKHQY